MEQTLRWTAAETLPEPVGMAQFERVRTLLINANLPPIPEVYELLWRYVEDRDHALSYAVDAAFARPTFDLMTALAIRLTHPPR